MVKPVQRFPQFILLLQVGHLFPIRFSTLFFVVTNQFNNLL
jgi:hypothetical protein